MRPADTIIEDHDGPTPGGSRGSVEPETRGPDRWGASPADPGPDGPGRPPAGRPGRHRRRPGSGGRRLVTAALLAVDGAAVFLTVADVVGPLRLWLGLAFILAVP